MVIENRRSLCYRCYHSWNRRKKQLPKICPKCKSPYWNKPRKESPKTVNLLIVKNVINIHGKIIVQSGGLPGVREDGGIYNSVVKMLKYQARHRGDVIGLGASILDDFAKRHYFNDGNKRTAYALAKTFMLINRCHLFTNYSDSVEFLLEVAKDKSKINFQEIKKWLKARCRKIEEKDVEKYLKDVLYDVISEVKENEDSNK